MSVPTSQPLTWIELLETIFFSSSKMTISLINFSTKTLPVKVPSIVTTLSHSSLHWTLSLLSQSCDKVKFKHPDFVEKFATECRADIDTKRGSWTTRDGPATDHPRFWLETIFWHFASPHQLSVRKCPGMLEQNFTELIRQTTNHQHHQLLFKGWQNSWVWNGWCLYKVTQGNDPISWQAEVIVRLCKPVQLLSQGDVAGFDLYDSKSKEARMMKSDDHQNIKLKLRPKIIMMLKTMRKLK